MLEIPQGHEERSHITPTHFLACTPFVILSMEPFPKKTLGTPKRFTVKSINIDLLCCCSIPDVN